jgi:Na+-driven multidrug efflux pump
MSDILADEVEEILTPPGNLPANKLIHGPLLPQLIRLALPTAAVLFMTTVLSVAETYFVSALGLNAIAAASLVVPVMLLMTTVASAGIGGGVSSAIARATGARRQDEAESLAWHAVVIGAAGGGLFSLVAPIAGPALYRALGAAEPRWSSRFSTPTSCSGARSRSGFCCCCRRRCAEPATSRCRR